jgi:zinc protease
MSNLLDIKYEKFKLENGLEVILYQNRMLPLVSVNLWYRVGSANERPGKTGFAHLFEHMMFQGSENVGKEKHFRYIQEAGGTLNGSTSLERTNYFETLPSNNLDLALWLESDRMGFMLEGLTQEKLDNQKDVVMNERRQRYENQPYGRAWEIIFSNLFTPDFPYHWPTIGWMEDIKNFNLNDIKEFFKTYYAPNNCSIVIAGDIDDLAVKKSIEKYFGSIPGNGEVQKITKTPKELTEDIILIHEDNVQLPRLYLCWMSDKVYGLDDPALDVLSDILGSSKNSRLYKSLVYEQQIAQDVSAFQYSANLTGMFFVIITAKPDGDLQLLKKNVEDEIARLIDSGVTEDELLRTKNGIKSSYIYSLQNIEQLANQINNYNFYLNEPNSFNYDLDRYNSLDVIQIQKIAKKYLSKPKLELSVIPKRKKTL